MKITSACGSTLLMILIFSVNEIVAQEGPGIVIAHPGEDVELLCNVTGGTPTWIVNNVSYTLSELFTGQLAGHSSNGSNIIVEDIMMNDDRNGNMYTCVVPQIPPTPDIISSPTILCVAANITFRNLSHSGDEDVGSTQVVLVLSNPLSMKFNVTVSSTDGTATGGSTMGEGVDYVSGPYNVTIPSGMTMMPFGIPINDDSTLEDDENFILTIDNSSLPTGVTVGSPQATKCVVTIMDNDPITVMFSETTYSVDEGAGSAQLVLVISNPSSMNFTVTVFNNTNGTATGGSTIGEGVDYVSGPYNVTIPSGMTNCPVNIPIHDDTIVEGNENFTLTIDPSSLLTDVTVGSPQAIVTIIDNDATTVTFRDLVHNVHEDAGSAQPVLVLSNPSSMDFNVTVFTTDGTATGRLTNGEGVDYVSGPYNVTFPSGMTNVSFNITIHDDAIMENNKTFNLTINQSSLPTGVTGVIVGSPQATECIVTIMDNDAIIAFRDSVYSAGEYVGPARPVLVISNRLSMEFNVTVFNTDGTATGESTIREGVDYVSGPYTVTVPSGMTSVSFDIPINDDCILEDNETFNLTINPSSLPNGVTVGSYHQATVTIVDCFSFWCLICWIIIIVVIVIIVIVHTLVGVALRYYYVNYEEHPDESIIRLVLLVILGVLTLSISNLIWYIYLKCQSEKDKAKCHSLLFVSLIVSYILSAGLSALLWCLIHQCCFKKKEGKSDTRGIPLTTLNNKVKPETENGKQEKKANEEPTDEDAQASEPAQQQQQQQQQANQINEEPTDEDAQASEPAQQQQQLQQQQQQANQKNEEPNDEDAQASKPAQQQQEANQKNEGQTDEHAQASKPAQQQQQHQANQKEGVTNYADLNIQKGPKRFGDADHAVQYGKVAETKKGVTNYADLDIQRGPKRFGDAGHDVQYGEVAETKQ